VAFGGNGRGEVHNVDCSAGALLQGSGSIPGQGIVVALDSCFALASTQ
jgi:hypothetical protein